MSEDAFDAIIVGGGLAGCVAAYVLASQGADVLVIERGNYAGAKNMTGGRLYAHSLEKIMPDFAKRAPLERKVTKEKVSFLTDDTAVTLDYHNGRGQEPVEESYTLLRGTFDQWLAEQAEEAGAQFITGIRVEKILKEDGKVIGVEADGDSLLAKTVILAEGVNPLLGEQLGMVKPKVQSSAMAVGAKELIALSEQQIKDRFNVSGDEGVAWLFAGSPSNGLLGGGFLYTNKDTVSLGIVCGLHHIETSSKTVPQMLEDFKNHPAIKPLIEGGKLLEYSGHVVPEAGLNMLPKLVDDGVLIAGDAAGFCLNVGYTVRGMDLAIASGEAAARAVLAAKAKNDFSAAGLGAYQTLLDNSFIMKDLKLYQKLPAFMENPRIFNQYPKLVADIMQEMFTIDGSASQPLRKTLMKHAKEVGYMNLIKDGIKGMTAI
ncbi:MULTISPECIES: FAD-dependent oxidoreductase [Shewanella]|uniref:FAD-dependent oxidoreductase n=1 Tax=Shewanella algae TaxID=38313 RepID=UPI000F425B4E|nr:FAD-dependent oxidoreductase [Shewanella algae]AYV15456.1 FAD-dependent oxidoreductase [Shewanella algae]MCE9778735.1 FAD-dependent oxidoreductase [Shewanella algae]MCE9824718.1 FAD-dependent oxidoreductase [Shewanella algae]QTE90475.1 FAD-dependent oxidoreductase [Shewanella algae]BCV59945.1 oxidoreductase FixC [Shewanella algae]